VTETGGGPVLCVFCEIVAGRAPADRIAENNEALAVLDIQPFAPGHTLVLSKRHVPWWHDLSPEEAASVFGLAHQVANRLRVAFDPEFVGMYARGRRIPHTHIFLVPTVRGDVLDRFFDGLEKVQETSDELSALRQASEQKKAALRIKGV
jgi:histidine triad (HIT) family protein